MTVRIVTDSTADIPPEIARELDITVVPCYVNMRGKSYRDGIDITPSELYRNMEEYDVNITTSQPPPGDFVQVYESILKEADDIVSIQCASSLSGIYQSALHGRDLVGGKGHIEVIDSGMTSMGLGIIAIAAARLAKTGASLASVMDETSTAASQSYAWGIFDTLKYAFRGGRLGKIKSLIGNILPVKPMLTLKNGSLRPTGVVRTRAKGIDKLLDNVRKFKNIHDFGIVHSSAQDDAQKLRAKLSALVDKSRIYISQLGPGIGVHGGPGVLILSMRASDIPKKAADLELEKTRKNMPQMPSFQPPKLNTAPLF
ncbi:MAG: DegV family protein [Dehalococcoidia bacterium]|nr:DegV family protein [Dehalococcoidia bacterium]